MEDRQECHHFCPTHQPPASGASCGDAGALRRFQALPMLRRRRLALIGAVFAGSFIAAPGQRSSSFPPKGLGRIWMIFHPPEAWASQQASPGAPAPPAEASGSAAAQSDDLGKWRTVLESTESDSASRLQAARYLVDHASDSAEVLAYLSGLINSHDKPDAVGYVCRAISSAGAPPQALRDPLAAAIIAGDTALAPELADALSRYGRDAYASLLSQLDHASPDASRIAIIEGLSRFYETSIVDALIAQLSPEQSDAVHQAAVRALARVTSHDEGDSAVRWQAWWRTNRSLGRDGLLTRRLHALERTGSSAGSLAAELQKQQDQILSELKAADSNIYLLTEAGKRNSFIATLLQNARPAIRSLGLDLVEQRALNAEQISPEVKNLIVDQLLNDPNQAVRVGAIRRLVLLDASLAASKVWPMLRSCDDPEVESAILSVLDQYIVPEAVPSLMTVFERGGSVDRQAAAPLVDAMMGGMISASDMVRLNQVLVTQEPATLTPAEAELLAFMPGTQATHMISGLIDTPGLNKEVRLALARGIALSGRQTSLLFDRVDDPSLYPFALQAVFAHNGSVTLDDLKRILGWKVIDEHVFRETLNRAMKSLPVDLWLGADDLFAQDAKVTVNERIRWLERVLALQPPDDNNPTPPPAAPPPPHVVQPTGGHEADHAPDGSGPPAASASSGSAGDSDPTASQPSRSSATLPTTSAQASSQVSQSPAGAGPPSALNPITVTTTSPDIQRDLCLRLAGLSLKVHDASGLAKTLQAIWSRPTNQSAAQMVAFTRLTSILAIFQERFGDVEPQVELQTWLDALDLAQAQEQRQQPPNAASSPQPPQNSSGNSPADDPGQPAAVDPQNTVVVHIAQEILERFKDKLTDDQRTRLTRLVGKNLEMNPNNPDSQKQPQQQQQSKPPAPSDKQPPAALTPKPGGKAAPENGDDHGKKKDDKDKGGGNVPGNSGGNGHI